MTTHTEPLADEFPTRTVIRHDSLREPLTKFLDDSILADCTQRWRTPSHAIAVELTEHTHTMSSTQVRLWLLFLDMTEGNLAGIINYSDRRNRGAIVAAVTALLED